MGRIADQQPGRPNREQRESERNHKSELSAADETHLRAALRSFSLLRYVTSQISLYVSENLLLANPQRGALTCLRIYRILAPLLAHLFHHRPADGLAHGRALCVRYQCAEISKLIHKASLSRKC